MIKGRAVFLRDFVQTTEVYTEAESAILFLCKKDWCSVQRLRGSDKAGGYMFVNKFSESGELGL